MGMRSSSGRACDFFNHEKKTSERRALLKGSGLGKKMAVHAKCTANPLQLI